MSFFRPGQNPPDPRAGGYSRAPPSDPYQNSGQRGYPSQPPSRNQLLPDTGSYEKRAYQQSHGGRGLPAPPSQGGGSRSYLVVECPSPALALTNCFIGHSMDFAEGQGVLLNGQYPGTIRLDNTGKMQPGTLGFSLFQRQWLKVSHGGDSVSVDLYQPNNSDRLTGVEMEIGFYAKNVRVAEQYDPEEISRILVHRFAEQLIGVGQILVFDFHGNNLRAVVLALERSNVQGARPGSEHLGILTENMTTINFTKQPDNPINLKASSKKAPTNAILKPDFKFEDMGIGGLDSEFGSIFRRAFASRVFPPGLVDKLGITHVKGILLYGPPGTGKTLMARQIGKMLNAREPKIVNGPEILNKYVGASEENIRKLFADAEKEYKAKGDESGLHIIIFDELDAICKQRGSTGGGTGVGDSVVNQLLSKMDGVDQLNNILIIGMTNRLDMIDEALLRPGRLEVHMEISLPDESGRLQILHIHTAKMRANNVMERDVRLEELAALTKNFSGAEINGLVKSATSFAFNRHVKVGTMAGVSEDVENLKVNRNDFLMALDEVHPAFGVAEEELQQVIQNGIIHFDQNINRILHDGELFVEQVRKSTRTPLVSLLLHGPPGSGKTALAATIAQASQFPFIKLVSPDSMVGFSEAQKIHAINKVFSDSYKSPLSVIVVDSLERLLDWVPIGPRFSNGVLQALMVLLGRRPPKGRRLLIIATTSLRPMLTEMQVAETFDSEIRVPPISAFSALQHVIDEVELFPDPKQRARALSLLEQAGFAAEGQWMVGVKKLLSVVEMARQEPEEGPERLVSALMGLGM